WRAWRGCSGAARTARRNPCLLVSVDDPPHDERRTFALGPLDGVVGNTGAPADQGGADEVVALAHRLKQPERSTDQITDRAVRDGAGQAVRGGPALTTDHVEKVIDE